jgi:hypothetical protein
MKVVNGGHDGPPATVAQMAAIEFPAAMEVARLPWASRTQSLFAMSTRAYQAAGHLRAASSGQGRDRQHGRGRP